MIGRLIRYMPAVLSSGWSLQTLAKLMGLCSYEPDLGGKSTEGPSIFVYAMY